MNRTGRQILRIAALGAAIGLCGAVSGALAAPPGDLPYGAYDPGGDYRDDGDLVIEHLFLPWEDVYLPSLVDADAYARARNRALIVTLEPGPGPAPNGTRPRPCARASAAAPMTPT